MCRDIFSSSHGHADLWFIPKTGDNPAILRITVSMKYQFSRAKPDICDHCAEKNQIRRWRTVSLRIGAMLLSISKTKITLSNVKMNLRIRALCNCGTGVL